MAPITQELEDTIDAVLQKRGNFTLIIGKTVFDIPAKNICFYGDVDFTDDSEDLEQISEANWLNSIKIGVKIPSNYDYETHTCKSDLEKYYKYHETFNPALVVQYKHGMLGKPKKVIIFKYTKSYD